MSNSCMTVNLNHRTFRHNSRDCFQHVKAHLSVPHSTPAFKWKRVLYIRHVHVLTFAVISELERDQRRQTKDLFIKIYYNGISMPICKNKYDSVANQQHPPDCNSTKLKPNVDKLHYKFGVPQLKSDLSHSLLTFAFRRHITRRNTKSNLMDDICDLTGNIINHGWLSRRKTSSASASASASTAAIAAQ